MRNPCYYLCLFICLFAACDKSNVINEIAPSDFVPIDTSIIDLVPIDIEPGDMIPIDTVPPDPIHVDNIMTISGMTNDFGWKLFQEIAKGVIDENVLISPLSVQTALSMALNGANSETLDEMLAILGCPGCDVKDINIITAQLRILMEQQSGHPRLISASGFFYDPERLFVYDKFIQTLSNDYMTGFREYNFSDPGTLDLINNWVKENTGGKIDKIIDEIGALDVAFLINALYFKADWSVAFHKSLTRTKIFTTAENIDVPVQLMWADRNFSTTVRHYFKMVDIPFKDSTYSISLVQPVEDYSASTTWILDLESSELTDMWSNLTYDRAVVEFPKLNIEYDVELREPLMRMGISEAFSDTKADFSNLGHALLGPNLYINKVRHKTALKIDEKGAEGAAVNSINFAVNSAPPYFIFNKPFVIVLRHTQTNTILFAGLINDPS